MAVLGFLVSERSGSGSTLVALYLDASSLAPRHESVQGWKLTHNGQVIFWTGDLYPAVYTLAESCQQVHLRAGGGRQVCLGATPVMGAHRSHRQVCLGATPVMGAHRSHRQVCLGATQGMEAHR